MWPAHHLKTTALVLCLAALPVHADEPWSFEQVISFAVTNNPDAQLARHRIAAANAALEQAQAAFRPAVQFQSSYLRTDNPMQVFGSALNQRSFSSSLDFNRVPDADNLNVHGVLTVPIYTGGKLSANREAARAAAAAQQHQAAAIRNDLEFQAARAFHTIMKTRDFVRAAEASVHSFESNLAGAQNRFDAGAILKSEILDVELQLAQARENLIRTRNATALAKRALKNLLGIEAGDFDIAAEADLAEWRATEISSTARPEIFSFQQRKRAAEAEVRSARSGYRPRVNAFGRVDYDHGWRFHGSGESYTAGITLQWDIFDGKLTRSKVRQAEAELAATREQERKVRLAIDFEVEEAQLRLHEARERLAVTDRSVALAAESAQLTRNRFAQGLALTSQLIDAETALTGARVRRAEAEADERIAAAALRKALGHSQLQEATR